VVEELDAMTIKIKDWAEEDQVDPAVELGVVAPQLPLIQFWGEVEAQQLEVPKQLIAGVLHKGCKLVLGGTSKSNKTWCLLDMAVSVASGNQWWGLDTTKAKVIYINFELHPWALKQRLEAVIMSKPGAQPACRQNLAVWNLRGHNCDMTLLRPQLDQQLSEHQFELIILDPAYKVLGDRDENSNGDIAGLFNEFEAVAKRHNAALTLAHHFAKGDSTTKQAMDRMSGAGTWVRDPDAILVMTPHEEADCFSVTPILRNLPKRDEFVVRWQFPLMRVDGQLNPAALRTPQSGHKLATDKDFLQCIFETDDTVNTIVAQQRAYARFKMADSTTAERLSNLRQAGTITKVEQQGTRVFAYRWNGQKT
jgi:hypothetical protein